MQHTNIKMLDCRGYTLHTHLSLTQHVEHVYTPLVRVEIKQVLLFFIYSKEITCQRLWVVKALG